VTPPCNARAHVAHNRVARAHPLRDLQRRREVRAPWALEVDNLAAQRRQLRQYVNFQPPDDEVAVQHARELVQALATRLHPP
jgi:hypothetical protein